MELIILGVLLAVAIDCAFTNSRVKEIHELLIKTNKTDKK